MGLDLQFISAATTKAMINAAAIEVAEKDVTYSSLEAAIDSLKLPKTDPGIGFDLKIHDTDKKLDLNKLGDPTKKVIVKSWGQAPRNAYFSGGWRLRRGRSGGGKCRRRRCHCRLPVCS